MPDDVVKDSLLSEFIARTGSDPALAWDLLSGTNWNLDEGLRAYVELANIPNDQWPDVLDCPGKGNTNNANAKPTEDEPSVPPPPSMQRGISRVEGNQGIVKKMHKRNRQNSGDAGGINSIKSSSISTSISEKSSSEAQGASQLPRPFPDACFSITIPDLSLYQKGFREYLERELVEKSTLVALQESGRLNWWTENAAAQPLYPMVTTGDGNCLLHAASLAMWGFHDRELVLRKALYAPLKDSNVHLESFKRRWRFSQTLINQQSGLIWSDDEWNREWDCMLQLASSEPRRPTTTSTTTTTQNNSCANNNNNSSIRTSTPDINRSTATAEANDRTNSKLKSSSNHSSSNLERQSDATGSVDSMGSEQYESLEEFHVFLLANILRRPVIIVADLFLRDNRGENFAPIPFGGVYLPLECKASECHHYPLLLTFDAAHFSALVPMEPMADHSHQTPQHYSYQSQRDIRERSATTTAASAPCSGDEAPIANHANQKQPYRAPVVIPLTDSQGELLHIHFTVDPGPEFDWSLMENEEVVQQSQLTTEDKLILLHKYLNIQVISLSGRRIESCDDLSILSTNQITASTPSVNGNGDRERAPKSKSNKGKNSRSSSVGSKSSINRSKQKNKSATLQNTANVETASQSRSNSSKEDSLTSSPRNIGCSGKSASSSTKPKVPKKQTSIIGNIGRKLRKCFNSNTSAINCNENDYVNSLLKENNALLDKVERTLMLLSVNQDQDRRFIAAKVDIAMKPGYFADMIRSYLDSAERKYYAELHQMSRKCRSCHELKCVCRVSSERASKPQTLPRDMKIDNNMPSPVVKHIQSKSIPVSSNSGYRATNARSESLDHYTPESERSLVSRRNVVTRTSEQSTRVFQSSRSYQVSSPTSTTSQSHPTTSSTSQQSRSVYRQPNFASSSHASSSSSSNSPSLSYSKHLSGTSYNTTSSYSNARRTINSGTSFPPYSSTSRVIGSAVITKCRGCRRPVEGGNVCGLCANR
ncbi:uncharacterized protein LOC142345620 isoform X2 [Convolutriloba macropyga]